MNDRKSSLCLFLSASFVVVAGCAAPAGESRPMGPEDTEDVAERSQAMCAAGALDCNDWGAWEAVPAIEGACGVPATAHYEDTLIAAYPDCGTNQIHVTSYSAGAWATPHAVTDALSLRSPSLAVYEGVLYLAYAAMDNRVVVTKLDGDRWTDIGLTGVTTTFAPVLTTNESKLSLVHGGPEGEISLMAWDRNVWTGAVGWGVTSPVAPSVAVFAGKLYAGYLDERNWLAVGSWDGVAFSAKGYVPGGHAEYSPTIAPYQGSLNVFYPSSRRGGVGWAAYDGADWTGDVVIPGSLAAYSPSLGIYGTQAALFARGLDDQIYWARHKDWAF